MTILSSSVVRLFRRGIVLFASATLTSTITAQSPHPLTPAERQHVDSLVQRMTLDQKLAYIGGTGFAIRAVPALNLPSFQMSDGPVGVRSNAGFPSTTYAGGIGLAASWDRALAHDIGEGIGRDARARGIHYMLGPGTNIYRSPRNGRNFEYFGEDPYLAGEMVANYVTGMQEQGVSSTVKHYLGNNSEYLRHDSDSVIDERALREIYLPAFESAVRRAHVGAVMDSYNLINGTHATQNGRFNIDVLRKEWGFEGTLMSDWSATYDGVAAANNGLDLEMPTGKFMNAENLAPAIKSGQVSQQTIDEKIRHILTTAAMFGWLDRTQLNLSISADDRQSDRIALQSARESAVLLKNDGGILPLDESRIRTILVVGPDAYPGAAVGGGSAGVVPFHTISLLEGVSSVAPGTTVLYDAGLLTISELAMQTSFTTEPNGSRPGMKDEAFESKDLTGTPRISTVMHLNDGGVPRGGLSEDLRARLGPLHGPSSHRYTGYYNAENAGTYLIAVAAAGEGNGNRVFVDGKQVIDDWLYVRAFEPHVSIPLSAGPHKVVVETWSNNPLGGRLRLGIVPEDKVVDQRALAMAAKSDAVVVAAGFSSNADAESEGEGGDRTFDLPYGQDALIRAMAAANPHTIVAVTSGGNVDSTSWIGKVPGLIEAWYGGQDGGRALAEILFGDVNPSGHLPATFERRAEDNPTFETYYPAADEDGKPNPKVVYKEGIFVGYRGYEHNHTQPLFPFGFGLSYTTFKFSNLKINPGTGSTLATVTFAVTNTGARAGAEVAQLYITEIHPKVPRPAHELKGFDRVELAPGETKNVSIPLDGRSFAYYNVERKQWIIDPARFTVSVGDSLESLPLTDNIDLDEQTIARARF